MQRHEWAGIEALAATSETETETESDARYVTQLGVSLCRHICPQDDLKYRDNDIHRVGIRPTSSTR